MKKKYSSFRKKRKKRKLCVCFAFWRRKELKKVHVPKFAFLLYPQGVMFLKVQRMKRRNVEWVDRSPRKGYELQLPPCACRDFKAWMMTWERDICRKEDVKSRYDDPKIRTFLFYWFCSKDIPYRVPTLYFSPHLPHVFFVVILGLLVSCSFVSTVCIRGPKRERRGRATPLSPVYTRYKHRKRFEV